MAVLALLLSAAALLLVVSGGAKLRAPEATVAALAALGLPRRLRSRALIRTGAAAEAAVGIGALAAGGWLPPALLGAAYGSFLAVAARLRATAHGAGCGCFGTSSAPVGRAHLLVALAGLVVGILAVAGGASPAAYLRHQPAATAAAAALLVVALTGAGYVTLTSWAETLRLARPEVRPQEARP